jgi:hypothetical protein
VLVFPDQAPTTTTVFYGLVCIVIFNDGCGGGTIVGGSCRRWLEKMDLAKPQHQQAQ